MQLRVGSFMTSSATLMATWWPSLRSSHRATRTVAMPFMPWHARRLRSFTPGESAGGGPVSSRVARSTGDSQDHSGPPARRAVRTAARQAADLASYAADGRRSPTSNRSRWATPCPTCPSFSLPTLSG